jgi:hypothetical protein
VHTSPILYNENKQTRVRNCTKHILQCSLVNTTQYTHTRINILLPVDTFAMHSLVLVPFHDPVEDHSRRLYNY